VTVPLQRILYLLAIIMPRCDNDILARARQGIGFIEVLNVEASIALPPLYRSLHLRHVATRDGERFVAVLDEQLDGAGIRDNLLHLTKVDQEGAMATDNHRIAL
jgi:hypothetical protein